MREKEYNGWTNYATWRVNLEIFDSVQWVREDFWGDEEGQTLIDLADACENIVEQAINENDTKKGLAVDYAMAFVSDVNYFEIAKSLADTYPDWKIKTTV